MAKRGRQPSLTNAQVRAARKAWSNRSRRPVTQSQLATQYDCTTNYMNAILNNRVRTNVN